MRKKYKKWSYELLHKTALQYETRYEFQKGSKDAYCASQRRGILDDVCIHMNGNTSWTEEMLQEEALKYETRSEFQKGSLNAYNACQYREILNEVCSHMQEPEHYSKPHCVYLIEIFTEDNELYYYVGQTYQLEKRLLEHFKYSQNSPVIAFLNENDIKYKKHYIVKDQLTFEESLELESETIKDLKDRGIKLLNKVLYIYNS